MLTYRRLFSFLKLPIFAVKFPYDGNGVQSEDRRLRPEEEKWEKKADVVCEPVVG